jgi:hypothetical protein
MASTIDDGATRAASRCGERVRRPFGRGPHLTPRAAHVLAALGLSTAVLGLSMAGLAGCGGLVVFDGASGEGGAGGAGSGSLAPTTSSGVSRDPAVAIVLDDGSGISTLRIANFGLSCDDPREGPPYAECGWFDLEIRLPSSYLETAYGEVDEYDDAVSSFYSVAGEPDGSLCSFGTGGGGDALFGTLRIVGADATGVDVELEGWGDFIGVDGVDGRFRAERCGG